MDEIQPRLELLERQAVLGEVGDQALGRRLTPLIHRQLG
jgi:hypothetical protein